MVGLGVEVGFGFFGGSVVWITGKQECVAQYGCDRGLTRCLRVLSLFVQDTLGVLGVSKEFGFSVLVGTIAFAISNFVLGEELSFSGLLGGFFGDGCFNQVRGSYSL